MWLEYSQLLAASGAVQNALDYCLLTQQTSQEWILSIDPSHASIITSNLQQRIAALIREHEVNPSLFIKFIVAIEPTLCPATLKHQQTRAKHVAAKEKIAEDPNILALQDHFNATILEDSILVH